MSYPTSEGISTHCEPLMSSTPSAVQVPNVPLASSVQNINPPSLMNYALTSNMASSVPTTAPQWHVPTIMQPNMDRSSPFFQTFLKGKPLALGILVICAAIFVIALSVGLIVTFNSITTMTGICFLGPVFCIVAGSLTIAAQAKPNVNLAPVYSIHSLLLVMHFLLFCVTITTSVYECLSLAQVPRAIQVSVMQNDVTLAMNSSAIPRTVIYSQPPPPPNPINVVNASPNY